ncbi:hypothetical protein CORC01_14411 [Colletotrichum orchidophilum]|uniref:Uncharacterized protein n=1 Tax=Colletotrichum orchidophilum TaxID=1209926 RepID=A0A1G4AM78_9PEZI|nr:uncharacterized protein CORC01_14411 [Colletotrichum orchidophilum]OHE90290.1 hypothetical protein CORC01_14411 [Colletotrichum orchidophilum]
MDEKEIVRRLSGDTKHRQHRKSGRTVISIIIIITAAQPSPSDRQSRCEERKAREEQVISSNLTSYSDPPVITDCAPPAESPVRHPSSAIASHRIASHRIHYNHRIILRPEILESTNEPDSPIRAPFLYVGSVV